MAFLVIAGYFLANAAIDYGIQVAFNYAQGYKGKDAWVNKVDFFDVAVSGGIGAITGGASTALKTGEKVGKVGMFVLKHPELVKLGEIAITSGIDFTGEGWQPVGFDDFGKRVIVGAGTYYGTRALGEVFGKKTPSIEQKVNDSMDAMRNSGLEIDRNSLTRSGRALQKHGSRPGSIFPNVPGKNLNIEGQNILNEILNSTNKSIKPNRFGGYDIFDIFTGRGVRFGPSNNFMTFLEP